MPPCESLIAQTILQGFDAQHGRFLNITAGAQQLSLQAARDNVTPIDWQDYTPPYRLGVSQVEASIETLCNYIDCGHHSL